jgi:hypothetical protein
MCHDNVYKKIMKYFAKKSIILFFIVLFLHTFVSATFAVDLGSTFVRLDSNSASQSPGNILVVATTNESVSEDEVRVTFGNAWTISSLASNFTVSTANLPSGVTAWPGIGTSTAVNGNAVTFPSNSLSAGTQYGFYISGGVPLNPVAGNSGDYVWKVATLVSSLVSSDSDSMIAIISDNTITVTGIVAADPTDLSTEITSTSSGTTFKQLEVIDYQIEYGSDLLYPTTLTLQAEWEQGSIGGGSPSIDILEYVGNSASDGYNSTSPVIDTINRTITWTITAFPASTQNQVVTFSLKTLAGYTNSSIVSFNVNSRILTPVTTSYQTVTQTYEYLPSAIIEDFGSSDSSDSDSSSDSITDSVQTPASEFVSTIIKSKSTNMATIQADFSSPKGRVISYGTSITNISKNIISENSQKIHIFELHGLNSDTQYFYQFKTINGESISDVFTFRTAIYTDIKPTLFPTFLNINNQGLVPYFSSTNKSNKPKKLPTSILTTSSPYALALFFENHESIDDVFLYLKNRNNVGIKNQSVIKTKLSEVSEGVYATKINTSDIASIYDVYIQVSDKSNNLNDFLLSSVYVVDPIKIINAQTNYPVEDVRIYLYKYDENLKIFEFFLPGINLEENPFYSNYKGEVSPVLSAGRYKINLSAIGYEDQELEFIIKSNSLDIFPMVSLEPSKYDFITFIRYHLTTVTSLFDATKSKLIELSFSNKFFDLVSLFSIFALSLLSVKSLTARTHISFWQFPSYIKTHLKHLFNVNKNRIIYGKVIDKETKKPISRVLISLFDSKTKSLSKQLTTNKKGYFHFESDKYLLDYLVIAQNHTKIEGVIDTISEQNSLIEIELEPVEKMSSKFFDRSKLVVESLFGFIFEGLLVFSFIIEILSIYTLGLKEVIPFLLLTIFNFILWIFYLSTHKFFN